MNLVKGKTSVCFSIDEQRSIAGVIKVFRPLRLKEKGGNIDFRNLEGFVRTLDDHFGGLRGCPRSVWTLRVLI